MSVQASSWVIKNSKHKGSALLTLLMIANHAHADGTNAFPSIETLAQECRMSIRQITRIIAALESSGELLIGRSGGRKSHDYAINMSDEKTDTNPDKLSTFNPDKMSRSNRVPNPDKFDTPTLTNLTKKSTHIRNEPSLEPSYRENTQQNDSETPVLATGFETQELEYVECDENGYPAGTNFKPARQRPLRPGRSPRASRKVQIPTGSPLPSGFAVSAEMRKWFIANTPALNLHLQTQKFINHYKAKGSTSLDWEATWQNWMLQAEEWRVAKAPASPTGPPVNSPTARDLIKNLQGVAH